MRLALLGLAHPFRGGVAHFTASLAKAFEKGNEVKLFSLARQYPRLLFPGKTQLDQSQSPHQYPAEAVLKPLDPLSWIKTGRKIRAFRPAAVILEHWHPFFAPSYAAASWIAKKDGAPIVAEMHNVLPHETTKLDRALLKPLFSVADGFVVHSSEDAAILKTLAPDKPVAVGFHPRYGHFGDLGGRLTRIEARKQLGLPEDAKVILFFGLVRAYKGLMDLVEALPLVPIDASYRVVVAGEFYEDEAPYRDRITQLGLEPMIRLDAQYIADEAVSAYFAASDVVVLPYRTATQSGIAQIALAEERPVIVTNVGGLPEAVAHEKSGLIAEPSNPQSLASMIRRFFADNLGPIMELYIQSHAADSGWDALTRIHEKLIAELRTTKS